MLFELLTNVCPIVSLFKVSSNEAHQMLLSGHLKDFATFLRPVLYQITNIFHYIQQNLPDSLMFSVHEIKFVFYIFVTHP